MDCSTLSFPVLHYLHYMSLLKLMSIELVMPFNHLILCHPLFLLPSVFPSIRVFSNESVLHIRWSKYWSFSFNISPSNEHSGLISFRIDLFDLAVQGTLKSLLQNHNSKLSVLQCSAFFPWRRAWQSTPVFLPGESPWTEKPGGLQSMGPQRVGHDWATKYSLLNCPNLVTVNGIQPQFFSVPFVDCWSECQLGNMYLVTCLPSKHKWLQTQQRHQCICRRNLWRFLVLIFHASLPTYHNTTRNFSKTSSGIPESFLVQPSSFDYQ